MNAYAGEGPFGEFGLGVERTFKNVWSASEDVASLLNFLKLV